MTNVLKWLVAIILLLLTIIAIILPFRCSEIVNNPLVENHCLPRSEWCELDDWCQPPWTPEPWTEDIDFPRYEHKILIGRLTDGIYRLKTSNEKHDLFFCGKSFKNEAAKNLSGNIAWNVVRSAFLASDNRHRINVWGWAGLLANESGFDLCLLGTNPRKYAYKVKALKRPRVAVTHSKEEILSAMRHPLMKHWTVYDLGMAQTLDIFYKGPREDLLEWRGLYWQAEYLHSLAVMYGTDRPWLYWPGYRASWKDKKVTRFARRLGARNGEI